MLVEGQTEEALSNIVLRQHLLPMNVYIERASLLRTKELPAGKPYKGGVTRYHAIRRDARRLLGDTDAIVTTMIDYYGLPDDFPGLNTLPVHGAVAERVEMLEAAFASDIGNPRFKPFLMLHEFESWVLAVPSQVAEHFGTAGIATAISLMVRDCGGAEMINDGPATHPSRRLDTLLAAHGRRYGKVADGPEIVRKAGLDAVRMACPHFNGWLSWLESLGQA